jgi:hypothetical protein
VWVGLLRLFPRYDRDDVMVRLFHKAVAHQWSAEDVDWTLPVGLTPRQAVALTNIITPVYLGEQAAMNGAALVLPQLISHGETAAQLYLSTFLLDEARHFDALTRLYEHLGNRPAALRRIPEMLQYHVRLSRGDRIDWLWGILISDLFARQFYLTFAKVQPGALFGQMSVRILQDESRHQAFAHTYLKNAVPQLTPARRQALVDMKDELLETMEAMNRRLAEDAAILDIDGEAFLTSLRASIQAHAVAIGLERGPSGGSGSGGSDQGTLWLERVAALRERAMRTSGGVAWPEPEAQAETSWRAEAAPGTVFVARDLPALTARDLAWLVGRPPRTRRVFPAAHPQGGWAECAVCALARLCRRLVPGRPRAAEA